MWRSSSRLSPTTRASSSRTTKANRATCTPRWRTIRTRLTGCRSSKRIRRPARGAEQQRRAGVSRSRRHEHRRGAGEQGAGRGPGGSGLPHDRRVHRRPGRPGRAGGAVRPRGPGQRSGCLPGGQRPGRRADARTPGRRSGGSAPAGGRGQPGLRARLVQPGCRRVEAGAVPPARRARRVRGSLFAGPGAARPTARDDHRRLGVPDGAGPVQAAAAPLEHLPTAAAGTCRGGGPAGPGDARPWPGQGDRAWRQRPRGTMA